MTGSNARTIGISPKLIFAVVGAVIAFLVTQELVDFSPYVDLIIQALAVAVGAFAAGPGAVTTGAVSNPPAGG